MFAKRKRELGDLMGYIKNITANSHEIKDVKFKDKDQQEIANIFNKMAKNDKATLEAMEKLIGESVKLSNFDVEMSHIARHLYDFSEELATTGESNMSVVDEVSASMNEVNNAIGEHSMTLDALANKSNELIKMNQRSMSQLDEVNELKTEVLKGTNLLMTQVLKINQIAKDMDSLLNGIEQMTERSHLLAMNASTQEADDLELSDAVAEIGTLSMTTKEKLVALKHLTSELAIIEQNGQEIMAEAEESSTKISEAIDSMSDTFVENHTHLVGTVEGVSQLTSVMQEISASAMDISEGMETSAADAERIALMTQKITDDSQRIFIHAEKIGHIDNEIAHVVKELMSTVNSGIHRVSNEQFVKHIDKAIESHEIWMDNLRGMVENMEIEALQTDGSKCAFGHFYHAIELEHDEIVEEWHTINEIHKTLHNVAHKVLFHIKKGDQLSVLMEFERALGYAGQIQELFDIIRRKVFKLSEKEERLFLPVMKSI